MSEGHILLEECIFGLQIMSEWQTSKVKSTKKSSIKLDAIFN